MVRETMEDQTTTQPATSRPVNWLRIALVVVFVIAAVLTAFLTYRLVRDLVKTWEITSLPGVSVLDATPTPDEEGVITDLQTPLQAPSGPGW